MARARLHLPTGHGEILADPPVETWAEMALKTPTLVSSWNAEVAGVPVALARQRAREEIVADAVDFTEELGLPLSATGTVLVVATGHQPDLFHPGIWVKDFLLQRLSDETGATAIDFVVDSDGFDAVKLSAPCMDPDVRVCEQELAVGGRDTCYACEGPPSTADVRAFGEAGLAGLGTLPAPAVARHFETYCACLGDAAERGGDLATALVLARRLYERPAGTTYLEEPVTRMSQSKAFLGVVAHIALDARRFAEDHNLELASFRTATRTRSAAQPFPDLAISPEAVELPLWAIGEARRPVYARDQGGSVDLLVDDEVVAVLPPDADGAVEALAISGLTLAPRALLLTLFVRMLVADMFIHGVGGARYDEVTDALALRYFGIRLPGYVTASMTMYLPIGVPLVSEQDLAAARDALHRVKHNPDSFLGDVVFESEAERAEAEKLAALKEELVEAIGAPGANKKELGARIRDVNERLGSILEQVAEELGARLQRVESEYQASSILTDRSYPFCLWSPLDVQDKAT